jgi:hypothetical protein
MLMTQTKDRRLRLPGWRPLLRWALAAASVVLVARVGGLGRDEISQAARLFADLDPGLIAAVLRWRPPGR